jgi:DNA-binding NarL/FixJ family response regulator
MITLRSLHEIGGSMRILLVDDHRLLLEGLANLLTAHGIQVAGRAYNGFSATTQVLALKPGVILMGHPHAGLRRVMRHAPDHG